MVIGGVFILSSSSSSLCPSRDLLGLVPPRATPGTSCGCGPGLVCESSRPLSSCSPSVIFQLCPLGHAQPPWLSLGVGIPQVSEQKSPLRMGERFLRHGQGAPNLSWGPEQLCCRCSSPRLGLQVFHCPVEIENSLLAGNLCAGLLMGWQQRPKPPPPPEQQRGLQASGTASGGR